VKRHVRLTLLFNLYEAMRISVASMPDADERSVGELCQLIEHAADDMAMLTERLEASDGEWDAVT